MFKIQETERLFYNGFSFNIDEIVFFSFVSLGNFFDLAKNLKSAKILTYDFLANNSFEVAFLPFSFLAILSSEGCDDN